MIHPALRVVREGPFSLERGLDPIHVFFKLGIILSYEFLELLPKRQRRPRLGRPRCELLCG